MRWPVDWVTELSGYALSDGGAVTHEIDPYRVTLGAVDLISLSCGYCPSI